MTALHQPGTKHQQGGSFEVLHRVEIETATDVLGESSRAAYERAKKWTAGAPEERRGTEEDG
jgi:hypothetical protein